MSAYFGDSKPQEHIFLIAKLSFNFQLQLKAELALFPLDPATHPHPPVKVYFWALAIVMSTVEQVKHKLDSH